LYNGVAVVDLEHFVVFLMQLLHLQQSQAFQIAEAFVIPVTSYLGGNRQKVIDLDAFEKKLYQQPGFFSADLLN